LLLLCLPLAGCGGKARPYDSNYDINGSLLGDNPIFVKLPYEETLDSGGLRISIRPIPGRKNAVRVKAEMSGFEESPVVEWTQEGCSTNFLLLDKGAQRYDVQFLELHPSKDGVSEVKLAIFSRSKIGQR
jgi:hypothetical protein